MEFKEELVSIGEFSSTVKMHGKFIMTTNVQDAAELSIQEQEDFKSIKDAFVPEGDKTLTIKLNESKREKTSFETVAHLFTFCKTTLDKFILMFTMIKLAIIEGKTVIMVHDIIQAYRIKYFLAKFSLKSFVLAPDMPKNQVSSIIHFFNIG